MTDTYRFADRIISITSLHEAVHNYCKDYVHEGTPEMIVEKSQREYAFEGLKYPDFSDAELEVTAVYRKIAETMPKFDTFVFHGSVVAVDGQAFLFTAKSGTGKSTHTRLWRELFGSRAVMVNDDKPLLRVTESGVIAYGTPYNGKHRLGENIAVPLKALCILTRAEENQIRRISKAEAYPMLMQQVYRPQDAQGLRQTLLLVDKLSQNTALYKLSCNMDISAAQIAYEGMK